MTTYGAPLGGPKGRRSSAKNNLSIKNCCSAIENKNLYQLLAISMTTVIHYKFQKSSKLQYILLKKILVDEWAGTYE